MFLEEEGQGDIFWKFGFVLFFTDSESPLICRQKKVSNLMRNKFMGPKNFLPKNPQFYSVRRRKGHQILGNGALISKHVMSLFQNPLKIGGPRNPQNSKT